MKYDAKEQKQEIQVIQENRGTLANNKIIIKEILDIGEQMIKSGAENPRTEDSMYRMCRAYGFVDVDVFVIPSNIQVTVRTADGDIITQIRHITSSGTNLDRLDYLNNLSRKVCAEVPDDEKLQEMIDEVMNRRQQPIWQKYIAGVMGGAGFCVFFAGSVMDCIVAAIASVIIIALGIQLDKKEDNILIYNSILAFVAETFIILSVHFGFGDHVGYITVGVVMLLVSALSTTNGIRDFLHKDVLSGILNVSSSIIGASGIAIGIALSIIMLRGVI